MLKQFANRVITLTEQKWHAQEMPIAAPIITQHVGYLDGWRGLAISLLLIGHFFPVPGINLGRLGVDLFFVLSGLLMSRLLFIKKVPIGLFYRRRIARIFPALFVFLLIILMFFFFVEKKINWAEVGSAAFFVNNYFQGAIGQNIMPFGHIWSLSVEEHAYVFLSLVAVCGRALGLSVRRVLVFTASTMILLGCVYAAMIFSRTWSKELWLHTEIAAYGIVISGALLLYFQDKQIPTMPLLAYVALGGLSFALQWWSVPTLIATFVGTSILALLINLLSAAPPLMKLLLSIAPLRQLGIWSFSLYVWQQPFYLTHHREHMPAWLALSFSLVTGICSYYLVERPARNYLNAKWR